MKFKLNYSLPFALLLSLEANAALKYRPGTYKIDPDHSRVGFVINHFVVSEEAIFDTNSIDTAVKKRDDHLWPLACLQI